MMKHMDKWNIGDAAADFLYSGKQNTGFTIYPAHSGCFGPRHLAEGSDKEKYHPVFHLQEYAGAVNVLRSMNFVIGCDLQQTEQWETMLGILAADPAL